MELRPKYVVFASTTALIGAFFALMVIILALDINGSDLAVKMGFGLLSLILFIAVAGSLSKNGQWSWRFLIFMEVVCTVVPMLAFLFDVMEFAFCVVMVALGCIMIIFTTTAETKRWVETDRV